MYNICCSVFAIIDIKCLAMYGYRNYRNHGELWLVLQNKVNEFNIRLNFSSISAMRIQKFD